MFETVKIIILVAAFVALLVFKLPLARQHVQPLNPQECLAEFKKITVSDCIRAMFFNVSDRN
jgi:hypothetical protein